MKGATARVLWCLLLVPNLCYSQAPTSCIETDPGDVVLCRDFDSETLGDYTLSELQADFTITGYNAGLTGATGGSEPKNRATIVNGANAVAGNALRSRYPANQIGCGVTGTCFLATLTGGPYDELYFGYWFRKDPGWPAGNAVKGGKLPGLNGGTDDGGDTTICCGTAMSLGRGFSSRWMFTGETYSQYMYWMDNPRAPDGGSVFGDAGRHRNPFVVNDSNNTAGTNAVILVPGTWYFHEQHVRLNDAGVGNGLYESWIDGVKTGERNSTRFRASGQSWNISKIQFSTHLGGGDASWESPQENFAYFDTLVVSRNRIWGDGPPPPPPPPAPPAACGS